jgi:hypothetical protein
MPLPSLATVADAAFYGYELPDDTAVTWLARASIRVRRAAGQLITSTTSTLQLTVEDWELQLPSPPITAVASVGAVAFDGTVTALVQGKDWAWNGAEVITFRTCLDRAEVVFTHGFTTVPDELIDLVCSVAVRLSNTPVGMEAGIRSVTIDDYSRTFAAEAREDAAVLLPGERTALNQILAVPSVYVVRSR